MEPVPLADVIYKISEDRLMAHSIAAVEHFIAKSRKKYKFENNGLIFPIKIKKVNSKIDNSNARASFGLKGAVIFVNSTASHNDQRRGIAHELGHILLSGLRFACPEFLCFDTKAVTEKECWEFADSLCDKHHSFYSDPQNIKNKCLF